MKYGSIIFAATSLTLAACSTKGTTGVEATNAAAAKYDVLGTYRATSSDELDKEYLAIGPNSVTLVKVCKTSLAGRAMNLFSGAQEEKVKLEVTVPARVTGSSIELLASGEKSGENVRNGCVAKLTKGVMTYKFNRYSELYLTSDAGAESVFQRLGKSFPDLAERTQAIPGIFATEVLDAPNAIANAKNVLSKDTGTAVTEVDGAVSSTTGTAVTKLKESVVGGGKAVLEAVGKNPPTGEM